MLKILKLIINNFLIGVDIARHHGLAGEGLEQALLPQLFHCLVPDSHPELLTHLPHGPVGPLPEVLQRELCQYLQCTDPAHGLHPLRVITVRHQGHAHQLVPGQQAVTIIGAGPFLEASRDQLDKLRFCLPWSHEPWQTKHLQHLLALLVHVVSDGVGQDVGLQPLGHLGDLLC